MPQNIPSQALIERLSIPEPMSGCWLWIGPLHTNLYGRIIVQGERIYAHQLSYRLFRGPVPDGLELDHLCRTPCCVNPDHLEPVTHKENCLRGRSMCARNAVKTHCPAGHPYDERNTRFPIGGGRKCRKCHATRQNARYHRNRVLLEAADASLKERV